MSRRSHRRAPKKGNFCASWVGITESKRSDNSVTTGNEGRDSTYGNPCVSPVLYPGELSLRKAYAALCLLCILKEEGFKLRRIFTRKRAPLQRQYTVSTADTVAGRVATYTE